MNDPAPETVRLAEYAELKSAIGRREVVQHALMALNLTAVGTVSGFVVSADASTDLLLVLSVISPILGLVWLDHDRNIDRMTRYLRDELWIWQPSWERRIREKLLPLWLSAAYWSAYFLTFFGASAAALGLAWPEGSGRAGEWLLWSLGAALSAIYAVLFAYAFVTRRWR
jgi:hypothetical protein